MERTDMKKSTLLAIVASSCLAFSCARVVTEGLNEQNRKVFDAWRESAYPSAVKTALGAYIIEDTPGSGVLMDNSTLYPYLRAKYSVTDLKGNYSATSYEDIAKQLGTYSESDYYGPAVLYRGEMGDGLYAGLDEAFRTMRVGGRRKVIIPGWLCSYGDILKDADYYLQNGSGEAAIYTLEAIDQIADIETWEIDSLYRYASSVFPTISPMDTLRKGLFYRRLNSPLPDEEVLKVDTTVYINYTGRLLNGKVFDTSVRDTAIKYGLYTPSTTYGPKSVTIKEDYKEITMSSSTLIDGFSYTLSKMHPFEKGVSMFYSGLGYGSSGSGNSIPSYCPLRFDIELVDKPE